MALYVTVELERKPAPLIVKFCGAASTVSELGDNEEMDGTSYPPPDAVTVKLTAPETDLPCPGC